MDWNLRIFVRSWRLVKKVFSVFSILGDFFAGETGPGSSLLGLFGWKCYYFGKSQTDQFAWNWLVKGVKMLMIGENDFLSLFQSFFF